MSRAAERNVRRTAERSAVGKQQYKSQGADTKKQWAIIVATYLFSASAAYAMHVMWTKTSRPPTSIKMAVTLAEAELKKEPTEYFCIGASLARTFSQGDWELHFSSKDGQEMWVSVGSDRKVRKSKTGFSYL